MLQPGTIVFPKGLIAPQIYRIEFFNQGVAELKPLSLGAVPMKSPVGELRRYRLRTTDEVTVDGQLVRVLDLVNPAAKDEELYRYLVEDEAGKENTLREDILSIHEGSAAADPADMLTQADFAPWDLVSARQDLLESFFSATARSQGISGYNGARMLPIPHQINAARYAAQFGRVRFLLADEVGLGKTVEAGLIVSTLRKYFPDWQTAIFVPESLTAQWAFEMYGKFGKLVFELDEDEYDEESSVGVILPHDRAKAFSIRNKPQILVVDEAHRILRTESLVQAFIRLSRQAHAVLLLTATPVSDDMANLLRLLQVLEPQQFEGVKNAADLRAIREREGKIEALLTELRAHDVNAKAVRTAWKNVGLVDSEMDNVLKQALEGKNRAALHRAASLAVDRHYPGARILRYRRKFLAQDNALPLRVFGTLEYKPSEEEKAVATVADGWLKLIRAAKLSEDPEAQRVCTALIQAVHSSPLAVAEWIAVRSGDFEFHGGVTADPIFSSRRTITDLQRFDGEEAALESLAAATQKWARATRALDATGRPLARTGRYACLLAFLKETLEDEPDTHLLLFTAFESNVKPLALLLRKALQDSAEVFEMSGRMSRADREKEAFNYQEFPSGSLLISDELGGEGRNFQFASHVIHYDLPMAAWVVEQRIGRCDRVGREEEMDVDSQVIVGKGMLDEAWCEYLAEGVGVFNESIAPIEGELDDAIREAVAACINEGAAGVHDLIEPVCEKLDAARERENAELLGRSAVGVAEARKIAQSLDDSAELLALRKATIRYARLFESMVDEQADDRVAITVGEFHSLHAVTGVSSEMIGYFDRRKAVRHERLNFFSPGHPFVRSMAMTAMVESPDRVGALFRAGVEEPVLLCLFRVAIPEEFFALVREQHVDLRPPLFSASAALFGTRMIRLTVTMKGEVVPRTPENEVYYKPAMKGDTSLDKGALWARVLTGKWKDQCAAALELAGEHANEIAELQIEGNRERFEQIVSEALARHNGDLQEIENKTADFLEQLVALNVDLDSVAILLPPAG